MDSDTDREPRFEQLLAGNTRRLAAIARSYAADDEWRDLYQEMLLQLWKSFDAFEGRSSADTWVYRIALNTALTYRRRASARLRQTVQADAAAAQRADRVTPPQSSSELELLREFIGTLGDVDRAIFMLYLDDLSYRAMADILGMSENHVGVRINRIKKAFLSRYVTG